MIKLIDNDPVIQVNASHNQKKLTNIGRVSLTVKREKEETDVHNISVNISKAKKEDVGEISFVAQNSQGKQEASINLLMEG